MKENTAKYGSKRSAPRLVPALFVLLYFLGGCGFLVRQATILYISVDSHISPTEVKIEVNKSFIEKYKNRVTIHATFTVDKSMGSPVPGEFDGDLHFAGRAPQVALPLVGEIANAADAKEAVDLVHRADSTGRPLKVSGVWRIWPEHAGSAVEKQGKPLAPMDSKSPDHVFEIHPATTINRVDLRHTFTIVKGFSPGNAPRTFGIYQKVTCLLTVKPNTVLIATQSGLYNDVEFIMEITDDQQHVVDDGRFVIAAARNLDGDLLVERLRMVFAKGTPPERVVKHLNRGDRLHVYGVPRVDFAEISRRVRDSETNPAILSEPLPYEIIVLGIYPDKK